MGKVEEENPFVDIIEELKTPIVDTPKVLDGSLVPAIPNKQVSTRFQPGQSGNPNGRPPLAHTVSDQLRRLFDMTTEEIDKFKPKTGAQVIALKMYKGADDPQVLKELLNRAEGKVTEHRVVERRDVSIVYEPVE